MSRPSDTKNAMQLPDFAGVPELGHPHPLITPSLFKRIRWIETVGQNQPDPAQPDPAQPNPAQPNPAQPNSPNLGQFDPFQKASSLRLSAVEINGEKPRHRSISEEPRQGAAEPMEDDAEAASDDLPALIHDMRNMVATIELYSDLLAIPDVLNLPFRHYAEELRIVGKSSHRMLQKMALLQAKPNQRVPGMKTAVTQTPLKISASTSDATSFSETVLPGNLPVASPSRSGKLFSLVPDHIGAMRPALVLTQQRAQNKVESELRNKPVRGLYNEPVNQIGTGLQSVFDPVIDTSFGSSPHSSQSPSQSSGSRGCHLLLPNFIRNLGDAIESIHPLISALAGPRVTVELSIKGGNCPVQLTLEDLTRILVNLTCNAVQAMPAGGHVQIGLTRSGTQNVEDLLLTFADSGEGIPPHTLEVIFEVGYSTHTRLKEYRSADHDSESPERSAPTRKIREPQNGQESTNALPSLPSPGSGLGLSIVQSIVKRAGGKVWAENRIHRLATKSGVSGHADLTTSSTRRIVQDTAHDTAQDKAQDKAYEFALHSRQPEARAPASDQAAGRSEGAIFFISLPIAKTN